MASVEVLPVLSSRRRDVPGVLLPPAAHLPSRGLNAGGLRAAPAPYCRLRDFGLGQQEGQRNEPERAFFPLSLPPVRKLSEGPKQMLSASDSVRLRFFPLSVGRCCRWGASKWRKTPALNPPERFTGRTARNTDPIPTAPPTCPLHRCSHLVFPRSLCLSLLASLPSYLLHAPGTKNISSPALASSPSLHLLSFA